jgi:hypothetical protein
MIVVLRGNRKWLNYVGKTISLEMEVPKVSSSSSFSLLSWCFTDPRFHSRRCSGSRTTCLLRSSLLACSSIFPTGYPTVLLPTSLDRTAR